MRLLSTLAITIVLTWVSAAGAEVTLKYEGDATDLPRKLLHARVEFPVAAGTVSFRYPEWIPGIHGPRGPIENLTGLRVETPDGDTISWKRDDTDRFLFHAEAPSGTTSVVVHLSYICSQPTTNSRGVDSYGNAKAGIINWNTCIVYPDGASIQETVVEPSLKLPEGWKHGSSMVVREHNDDVVSFEALSLEAFVDSPLLCGEYMRDIELETGDLAPVTLHLLSESASALNIDEELIAQYGKMASEAYELFGGAHFDHYALLLAMSDDFPYTGLEHLRSSLNAVGERDLFDEKELRGWVGYLIPHEFVHSWCGKYRRPAGMATRDFHTPKHTNLLWVYEGLTQYLGHVLTVRAGIWELDHYREVLALNIANYMRQSGRDWRTLEDTAADSYHLRGGSKSWSRIRRGQDYYSEGLLLWLEADAMIRNASDGKRSLDDFCQTFMGPDGPDQEVYPHDEDDVTEALESVEAHDWAAFVDARVKQTQESFPLDLVAELGYRLQYATEPSAYLSEREKDRNYLYALDSLGINVSGDGRVYGDVVPGMPAEAAGFSPGMEIVGVNERTYSKDRLRDAIADSVTRGNIEFLIAEGDVLRTIIVDYDGGPKYLELVRDEDKPDRLAEILEARTDD